MNQAQKSYSEMTTEEQLRWVQDFSDVTNRHGERIMLLAKDSRAVWTADDQQVVARLFSLLGVWPFAKDFVANAQKYGDFSRRAYRLPVYIEKMKASLADGLTVTDEKGNAVAIVLPGVPMRRRGRPTKEDMIARSRGEVVVANDDSPETRKRMVIAKLLGIEVVAGKPVREKNNAELKAERDAKASEKAKTEPSLFGGKSAEHRGDDDSGIQDYGMPACRYNDDEQASAVSPCAQLMSDSYEMRMAQDKMHLNQLAWMLSESLAKRVGTVQGLRVTAEIASERAKLLAEQGADASVVQPYAQQAKEATEAYQAIYADVDEELAVLHKRLYLDEPFVESFKQRFKGVNIERVQYITRPYYEKVKSPALYLRIKAIIEQENPEYAARMKAEEEKKLEVSELLRYLKRKDKPNVARRIKTMEKRYARLVELLGEQEARGYRPIVDAAREDYEKNYRKGEKAATMLQHRGQEKEEKEKEKKAEDGDVKKNAKKTKK